MAISKKNKNRVTINGIEYLWWVFDEYDQTEFDGIQIKVVCSDQTHFFKYGLQERESNRKVVLALRDYAKLVHLSSPPKFENEDGIITKSGIIRLIKWCKNEGHQIQYALDGKNNGLTNEQQEALLEELQKRIN
ncbi:MAG: hypothetical protein GQ574_10745 [Crocinitomix sp.]|nr:hypothetical protein [Crocinitomix sp.]